MRHITNTKSIWQYVQKKPRREASIVQDQVSCTNLVVECKITLFMLLTEIANHHAIVDTGSKSHEQKCES